jgi:pimeloyl-ACP methyl ester carboxylesterase
MKISSSHFLSVRGLRQHVRTWGDAQSPQLFLLHGWMDLSASFQFVVDAFTRDWHVIAPDFRGFGLSEWAQDGYWFPDYFADLDAILEHYSPRAPVTLAGHSMGGNIASLYAGIRPERVQALANLEGFGLPPSDPAQAPQRFAEWLQEVRDGVSFRPYASVLEYAARLRKDNPRLSEARTLWLAEQATRTGADGSVRLRGDPRHKRKHAVLYRLDEAMACWRRVAAPVLWVGAADSWIMRQHAKNPQDYQARKACFAQLEEHLIEDCGHMMHLEQPEQVARLIEEFASKYPLSRLGGRGLG